MIQKKENEIESFTSFEQRASQFVEIKERFEEKLTWGTDEYGDKIQVKNLIPCGLEIVYKSKTPQEILDKLTKTCQSKSMIAHFTRLRVHKPYAMGEEIWSILIEDLCKDLSGVSEYAVIKICEKFRKSLE